MRSQYRTTPIAIACQVMPDQIAAMQPAWTAKNGTRSGYMISSWSRSILVGKLATSVVFQRATVTRAVTAGSMMTPKHFQNVTPIDTERVELTAFTLTCTLCQ